MLRLPPRLAALLAISLLWPALSGKGQTGSPAHVQAVRFWSFGDVTRVAIQTDGDYKLFSDQIEKPPRVYFDLTGLRPPVTAHHGMQIVEIKDRLVKQIRLAEVSPGKTRVVFDLECPVEVVSSQLVNPDRLMIELRPKSEVKPTVSLARSSSGEEKIDLAKAGSAENASSSLLDGASPERAVAKKSSDAKYPVVVVANKANGPADVRQSEPAREQVAPQPPPAPSPTVAEEADGSDSSNATTPPNGSHETAPVNRTRGTISAAKRDSAGDRSLVRVFGLKLGRVVIDAGHGGHDTGTIGPNGLMEKDLVLDVALRLGKLITKQLGAEVVYTRSADVFIPLEQRTRIANHEKADLFISIHANSSPESSATGVETFYFNLTSDRVGLDLATRENATSLSSISDLNDLLHKAVLENKLEESREFAQKVQSALWSTSLRMNSQSRDRGIRQAPFVVLIGASMPSILAEIGFVSNPHDERLMKRVDQRQKIAEALLKGISQYASTLSHVQIARAGAE